MLSLSLRRKIESSFFLLMLQATKDWTTVSLLFPKISLYMLWDTLLHISILVFSKFYIGCHSLACQLINLESSVDRGYLTLLAYWSENTDLVSGILTFCNFKIYFLSFAIIATSFPVPYSVICPCRPCDYLSIVGISCSQACGIFWMWHHYSISHFLVDTVAMLLCSMVCFSSDAGMIWLGINFGYVIF